MPICDVRVNKGDLGHAMHAIAVKYRQVTMTIDIEPFKTSRASSELESEISVINCTERDARNTLLVAGVEVLAARERLR